MMMKRKCSLLLGILFMMILGSALAMEGYTVPDIQVEQQTIPDNQALAFTRQLKAGWNLGNTFDAVNCGWLADPMLYESAWSGTLTDPRVFDAIQQAGFASVRIPVSWHNHVSGDDYMIDAQWLSRIQEVVGFALDRGLYVILNTHHDIDTAYIYPDMQHLESSSHYLTCIWEQVARAFQDTDEHLLFEGMNEPRLKGTPLEWTVNPRDEKSKESVQCINALNQVFVDAVRAAGGQNGDRYLLVPGYAASLDGAIHNNFVLPRDTADNRIIVSVHAYIPYAFALQDPKSAGSTDGFDSNSRRDRSEISNLAVKLYQKYIGKGIPVVIGEFGARDKNGNLQARMEYAAYYTAVTSAYGIPCFIWDNHAFVGSGELFGLLDRETFTFVYPGIIESIMKYAQ